MPNDLFAWLEANYRNIRGLQVDGIAYALTVPIDGDFEDALQVVVDTDNWCEDVGWQFKVAELRKATPVPGKPGLWYVVVDGETFQVGFLTFQLAS